MPRPDRSVLLLSPPLLLDAAPGVFQALAPRARKFLPRAFEQGWPVQLPAWRRNSRVCGIEGW